MIANFFLDSRIGGPHHYIKNINEIISLRRNKINYITCGKSSFSNFNLINLRFILKPLFIFEILLNITEIFILIFRKKVKNIFFVHGIHNIAPVIAGSLLGKKVYWFILETPSNLLIIVFKIFRLFFNFRTVVISKKIAHQLKVKKYIYLPPIINLNFWKRRNFEKYRKKKINILCVGNINKIKGYDFLLENLRKTKFNWTLKIVGAKINTQKKYLHKINSQIKEIESEKQLCKIKLTGWQSSKKLRHQYGTCDIFMLPSYSEGSPMALFEAMAMGCFCIAARVGDVSRIIVNGKNGLTFDHNKTSFNNSLRNYLKLNHKGITQIKKRARKSIQDNLLDKNYYINFYKKVVLNKEI